MKEYDIVVVGAGPGGCSAAKVASEKGAAVLVLEEHPQVGFPRHCTGLLMSSSYNAQIRRMVGEHVILQSRRIIRVFAPSGKMLKEIPIGEGGCCIMNRPEFDKELAKLAVHAGAAMALNTRVTGLLKEDERIVGVTTASRELPQIRSKCVIIAGGLKALASGIPKQEGMTGPNEKFVSGLMLELANVRDIEPDTIEWWYCKFPTTIGCFFIEPLDNHSCICDVQGLADFENIKKGDYPFSYKVRDAFPVRIWGTGPSRVNVGLPLPETCKDGMILVGSAAGFNGIQPAILTGRYAAEVACEAIRNGNVTKTRLKRYEDMWKNLGLEHMYDYWRSLRHAMQNIRDGESLERDLEERVRHGEDLISRFVEPY
jgi:digeranylgeranylglycerophospholipid reductase